MHLPDLLKAKSKSSQRLKTHQIDLFIGIDAPDFNLRIGKILKPQGVFVSNMSAPRFGHGEKVAFITSKQRQTWYCACFRLNWVFIKNMPILLFALDIHF